MAEAVGQLLSDVLPDGAAAAREIGSLPAARWPLVVGLSLAVHLAGWALVTQAWQKVRNAAIDEPAPTVLIQVVQAPPRPPAPPAPPPPKPIPEPKPEPRSQARPELPPPPPVQKPAPRPTPVKQRPKAHPKPAPKPVRRAAPSRPKPRAVPPKRPPSPAPATPAQTVIRSPASPSPPRPTAPPGPPREKILASYLARLQAAIRRHRFYPARSRRRGEEGKVLLTLRIGRDGTLQEMALNTSSGHRRLDRAALQTIERLGKASPLPKDLPDETLEVEVPIRFQLRD